MTLIAAILDYTLPDETRENVVDWVLDQIPGTSDLETSVDDAISAAGTTTGIAGLIGLVVLLWSATGMMTSLRVAFAHVWEFERPSFVRGKLVDGLLVLGGGLVIVVAFGATVLVQVVESIGDEVATSIGLPTHGRLAGTLLGVAATLAVTFLALVALYHVVSPPGTPARDLLPGAAVAAIGLQALTFGYSIYLANFSDLNALYGSLGAILGFLLLVYLGAIVALVGGEISAAWPGTALVEDGR
jgi:membrane protein